MRAISGSLFNIQNGTNMRCPARTAFQPGHCQRRPQQLRTPRRLRLAGHMPNWCLRGGYGLFYGERDQNQQVTQFSGNLPNVPVPSPSPATSAIADRNSAVYDQHSDQSTCPHRPVTGNSFTSTANPYVGTIRYGRLPGFKRPHAASVQLRYPVSVDVRLFLLETSYSGAL